MKMKKSIIATTCGAALLPLLLTGCGNDKYLTYKAKWLKSRYPKDEIISSVQHFAKKGKLLYPESEIMKCLKS